MAKEFKLQDPGEGIHEAEVREVHVSAGDSVSEGDILFSIETDKAVNDVEAPFSGTIDDVSVSAGDQIRVGQVLLTYNHGGGEDKDKAESSKADDESGAGKRQKDKGGKERKDTKEETEPSGETGDTEGEESEAGEERDAGEMKEKVDKEKSGKSRKDAGDDKTDKPEREQQESRKRKDADKEKSDQTRGKKPVPAAPATRRLARELEIDLHQVEGSGPEGRVTADDVRAFAEEGGEREKAEAREEKGPANEPELPDFSQWGPVERKPFRSVRKATARQMSLAWSKIPHVMHREMADITELEAFRQQHKASIARQGGKLTLTVLIMKAVIAALRQFPDFNSSLDEANGEIVVKGYHHMGVAVSTEHGLLVPVIRDADRKSITELAEELTRTAQRARQGELKREDMQGGTFTITNPGPLGGDSFTPIINYPEAAILGVGSARLEPVVVGDRDDFTLEARLRVPLCLVYDHRLNDGASAARFLHTIVETLHDPDSYLLSV